MLELLSSHIWRGIRSVANETIPYISKDISDGKSTSFWYEQWVEDEEALINLLLNQSEVVHEDSVVSD